MIGINYSEETMNSMSKEQLIEYCKTLLYWKDNINGRLDRCIKFCDDMIKEKDKLYKEYENYKSSTTSELELMAKEICTLQEKLKNVKC